MAPIRQIWWGAAAFVAGALCCFTPLVVVVLSALGLSAAIAWLDPVLLPLMAVGLVVMALGLWRFLRAGGRSRRSTAQRNGTDLLTLVYFEGCPNAPQARAALQDAGRSFREVRQDDLPDGHPLRGYTSPTILAGERLLYGMPSGEAGCSVAPLAAGQLLEALRQDGVGAPRR